MTQLGRVLIVDDDPEIRELVQTTLLEHGFSVVVASTGGDVENLILEHSPDLVLLDLGLPDIGGLDVLVDITSRHDISVIVLTGRSGVTDRVVGLELGADDYVTKPFSLRELLARVKAMLRRRGLDEADPAFVERFALGDGERRVDVDLAAFTLTRDGETHALSPKEAGMLRLLRVRQGRAVSRNEFLREVWGGDGFVGDRTIDTHMLNLRQKLERDHKRPRHLLTVHGVGYRLLERPDEA